MNVTITLDREELLGYGRVLDELAEVCRFLPLGLLKDRFLEFQKEELYPLLPPESKERFYLEWDVRFRREAEFFLFKYLLTKIEAALETLPKLLAHFISQDENELKIGTVAVGQNENRIQDLNPEWVGENLDRLVNFERLRTEIHFIQLFFYDLVVIWYGTKQLDVDVLPLTIQESYIRSEVERMRGVQMLLKVIRDDVEELMEQKSKEARGYEFRPW